MTSLALASARTTSPYLPRLSALSSGKVLFVLDLLAVLALTPVGLWLGSEAGFIPVLAEFVFFPPANLLLLFAMGLYRRDAMLELRRALARVPLVVGMGVIVAVIVTLIVSGAIGWPLPRPIDWGNIAAQAALAEALFILAAVLARAAFRLMVHRGVLHRHLLVIGAGARAWELLHMLGKEGSRLHDDVVFLHDPAFGARDPRLEVDPRVRVVEGLSVLQAVRASDADQIVVAPDERRGMDLERLLACKKAGFPVVQYLTFVEKEIRRVDLKRMELGWLLYSDGFRFNLIDRILKRVFDLVVSGFVLALMSPFLVLAMLAIRLEGPGSILYRQTRVTRDGQPFQILKLRTMRVDAEAGGAVWARKNDDRITAVGRFLRRARIDELPQLLNILKGDMSFVGPRPERPEFVAELGSSIPLYNERHMVKAGLTGWAQINYPYGASVDDARSKLSYDLYYVKNFSILFDFVILLQTLRVVLWPSGVR
jgi:sugar transferase (PEP-CTERM system associated)